MFPPPIPSRLLTIRRLAPLALAAFLATLAVILLAPLLPFCLGQVLAQPSEDGRTELAEEPEPALPDPCGLDSVVCEGEPGQMTPKED